MKLSIVIPVYNEVGLVRKVLRKLNNLKIKGINKELIVIDDGSTDGTTKLLDSYKNNYHYRLFKHPKNLGKGAAVKTGLRNLTGQIVIIQDADLEYDIKDYPELLKPILDNQTKFVLGSRHLKSRWKIRKFAATLYALGINLGRVLYTNLFNLLYGVRLTDPASMYKVFSSDCLKGINFKSNKFELDWEMVAKFIKKGHIPKEIPISYRSRSTKEGKKIKFLRDGIQVLFAIIRFRFTN